MTRAEREILSALSAVDVSAAPLTLLASWLNGVARQRGGEAMVILRPPSNSRTHDETVLVGVTGGAFPSIDEKAAELVGSAHWQLRLAAAHNPRIGEILDAFMED